MRKLLAIFLTTFLIVITASTAGAHLKWHSRSWVRCEITRNGHVLITRTIICAVNHFPVPGGTSRALQIAERESGLNPYAVSPTGCCLGIYQQHRSYWAGRRLDYLAAVPRWLGVRASAFIARANILVSLWMVHHLGWCPNWC